MTSVYIVCTGTYHDSDAESIWIETVWSSEDAAIQEAASIVLTKPSPHFWNRKPPKGECVALWVHRTSGDFVEVTRHELRSRTAPSVALAADGK